MITKKLPLKETEERLKFLVDNSHLQNKVKISSELILFLNNLAKETENKFMFGYIESNITKSKRLQHIKNWLENDN